MSGLSSRKESTAMIADGQEDERAKQPLAELRNGKVYFKQKCVSLEKQSETLQEIVKFREMLEELIKRQQPPLSVISEEHLPLIVKLAHESDKTLSALSKQIRQELRPSQNGDEDSESGATSATSAVLPPGVVETAIQSVMERINYGLDGVAGTRPPAALCVWRWEAKEQYREWLPKNALDKAECRRAERIHAKEELLKTFESLPQDQRDAIMYPKGTGKLSRKETNVVDSSKIPDALEGKSPPRNLLRQEKRVQEENDPDSTKVTRAFKQTDAVKVVKDQEKLEKKAAKEMKEKKDKEAHEKSRSMMANFFTKPKKTSTRGRDMFPDQAESSSIKTDFEKMFKPFVLKKGAEIAPVNWFLQARQSNKLSPVIHMDNNVIVIDDADDSTPINVSNENLSPIENIATLDTPDHIRFIVSRLPQQASYLKRRLSSDRAPQLKTHNVLSVRDIFSRLTEAEVAGDDTVVRSLLLKLADRSLLPAKVFIFHEDARPGYYGTWTRNSQIIGPRAPFAKDVIAFDYGYDSGADWEPEPTSDVEDIADDGEDEDEDDAGSDTDSWLVDDDEEYEGRGVSVDDQEQSPLATPDLSLLPSKRKAEDGEKTRGKKRKAVVPLVPFAKGASWEAIIGRCEHKLFNPYKIHLFNDSPFPMDPFTFVSTCIEDSKEQHIAGPSGRQALSDEKNNFVIPNLPDRMAKAVVTATSPPVVSLPSTLPPASQPTQVARKSSTVPKTPFPDAHLPFLLEKIDSLQTGSLTFLVEAIYRELREHNVKKNMIESKVREVGEKCKEKKLWVVKPGIQAWTFNLG